MSKTIRLVTIFVVLALLVSAFSIVGAQDGRTVLRTSLGESDVPTLDPSLGTDTNSIQIINQAYTGLTVLDEETLEVAGGLAESWEMVENEDGTVTYTFTLRQDVTWVKYNAETGAVEQLLGEDGNPINVTANDVYYGWMRTFDPATASEYAYVLAPQVLGASEFNAGTGDAAGVAISAPDDFTFVVTAPAFLPYQISIYGLWMARPQLQSVIEEHAEFWIEAENYVSYGPYAVKEWSHDEVLILIKNPFWPGTEVSPQASIDEIEFYFMDDATALAEYEAGNLDMLDTLLGSDVPRVKADPVLGAEYYQGTSTCSYYYGFSVGVAPFDNVHIRRAFSYAVDREDIVENITRSGQTAAPYFTLPNVVAAPHPDEYPDLGINYDPDMAREELALGLAELGLTDVSELAPVTLLFNTNAGHQLIAEAISAMWAEELGVTVQLTNQDFGVYLEQRATFPVWRAGWCYDYPDAASFTADVFRSTSNNNDTGWSSPEFDALVDAAAQLTDSAERAALYAQAEQMLVYEAAAIIPIYWYSDIEMTKPYVERTFSQTGDERFENWSINN